LALHELETTPPFKDALYPTTHGVPSFHGRRSRWEKDGSYANDGTPMCRLNVVEHDGSPNYSPLTDAAGWGFCILFLPTVMVGCRALEHELDGDASALTYAPPGVVWEC